MVKNTLAPEGYPLPRSSVIQGGGAFVWASVASSNTQLSIHASRVTFAAILAALTMGYIASAFL